MNRHHTWFARLAALVFLLALLSPVAFAGSDCDVIHVSPDAIQAHMRFLADDLLEGRETGTRGEAIAGLYVASELEELGLEPAGSNGTYFQTVPLLEARPLDQGRLILRVQGVDWNLRFARDYLPVASFDTSDRRMHAPVVFVGFGISAAKHGLDSYAGLDVRGKIVAVLGGAPSDLPSEERSYYSSTVLKRETAARHGAAALLLLYTPTAESVFSFEKMASHWQQTQAAWTDASGKPFAPGVPELAVVSLAGAQKLFTDAPVPFNRVVAAAERPGGRVHGFPLPAVATARIRSSIIATHGANVIGVVPGSDPQLKSQYVVLSAHYDHLGVKPSGPGHRIYNGALDNAAGVSVLLETARAVTTTCRPRRSLLFAIVTAEEKGLVGSDYFARHPTVPRESLVANVNMDMPLLAYDFQDIIAFGGPHSSLGLVVEQAAATMGIRSSPDPVPEQTVFIRSDQYSFVQQGIPSVDVATGFAGPGRAAYEDYLEHRYHQTGDTLSQSIDYAAGAKLTVLMSRIAMSIADQAKPPSWNAGDFFAPRKQP